MKRTYEEIRNEIETVTERLTVLSKVENDSVELLEANKQLIALTEELVRFLSRKRRDEDLP